MKTLTEIQASIWALKTTPATHMVAFARSLEPGPDDALISTCTRVEFYSAGEAPVGIDAPPETVLRGPEALEHLAVVASGADSLVVGETDVLSQVRAAFTSTSGDLRAFGDAAIAAGREARRRVGGEARDAGHQLDIALASAGVQPPRSVVIVGTGAMAGHLARRARELGSAHVAVTGRNFDRARRCADAAQAEAIAIEALPATPRDSCLILAYRGVAAHAVREGIVQAAGRASLVIDLTMPPFDWKADRPAQIVDLELMARTSTPTQADLGLQRRLTGVARDAIQRLWAHRYATGAAEAAELYRRVEQLRQREVARTAKQMNADIDPLNVVTKVLVKRLSHRYAEVLRRGQDPALLAASEELFRFEAD